MSDQPKTGAALARGKSKQDYSTPLDFMEAVAIRFGRPTFDLAADSTNWKAADYFTIEQDSLKQQWHKIPGWLWLNPPFGSIEIWASKCAAESALGAKILFLTPASIGSSWFQTWVHPCAVTLALNPRLCFDGKNPYPKDCQLSVFCAGLSGFNTWRWK